MFALVQGSVCACVGLGSMDVCGGFTRVMGECHMSSGVTRSTALSFFFEVIRAGRVCVCARACVYYPVHILTLLCVA